MHGFCLVAQNALKPTAKFIGGNLKRRMFRENGIQQ